MQEGEGAPIKLFYSYSHKDEELRNELAEHLFPLERAGVIEVWHDRGMLPGDTVDEEIAQKLRTADLVLVLVSPSFIRSEYCYDIEFKNAIERHKRGEARVVPVVLRPCQWQLTPLKNLLAMPTDGRAVINWPNKDTAFNDVAKGIAKLAKAMRQKGAKAADQAAAGAKPAPSPGTPEPSSSPHPDPLPLAGEGGTRDSGRVRVVRAFADLAVFRDGDALWCPEMVVIPAGQFLMGSPKNEKERWDSEGPQHLVTIGYRFAMGRYAVTVSEYGQFVEATSRDHTGGIYVWSNSEWKMDASKSWRDPGFKQTERHPAVGVSWQDAMAFCDWLGKETGKLYRLPNEAEWEYACRAGKTTPFSFGETITTNQVNYDGNYTYAGGPKGESRQRTVPVGALPSNSWGLHEMHGNVWEWVEDHWHDSYEGAPADGAAWTEGEGNNCSRYRVLRGGSWANYPGNCRSANRNRYCPVIRNLNFGFRLARTLD